MRLNAKHGRARRAALLPLAAALLLVPVLSACTLAQFERRPVESCTQRRLGVAYALYDEAKRQLTRHYEQRNDLALEFAYHASRDSMSAARTIRTCYDFDTVAKEQAVDLIRSNMLFQKLVVSNMRDQDPSVVIGLYGERYREIFKSDIR